MIGILALAAGMCPAARANTSIRSRQYCRFYGGLKYIEIRADQLDRIDKRAPWSTSRVDIGCESFCYLHKMSVLILVCGSMKCTGMSFKAILEIILVCSFSTCPTKYPPGQYNILLPHFTFLDCSKCR